MPFVLLIHGRLEGLALYGARLRSAGYEVGEALTAHGALSCLQERVPHAIVVDSTVPDADPLRLCASIRRLHQVAGLPIIFLASPSNPDRAARLAGTVVTELLYNPVDADALVQALGKYCAS